MKTHPITPSDRKAILSPNMQDLPAEILIEVLSLVDFVAFDSMRLVNRRLAAIADMHWQRIMAGIITREFHPVDEFFAAFFAAEVPPGLLAHPPLLLKVVQELNDRPMLIDFCRVIKRWEVEMPRLRFAKSPAVAHRSLLPHELTRMRGALYFWWRYARAFHGHAQPTAEADHYLGGLSPPPKYPFSFTRNFSTSRLLEALDLFRTVRSALQASCPSIRQVTSLLDFLSPDAIVNMAWGDDHENACIIATMMRLLPREILHIIIYRHTYPTQSSLISFIRLCHPKIEDSAETFMETVSITLCRRQLRGRQPFGSVSFPAAEGGILDHSNPEDEDMRVIYDKDANLPTGLCDCVFETKRARLEPSR
ncbi:hypothetical protein B0J18DRAFT_466563 [Chaetomium sp. MPI-SDFR-AT-0129]|nr:hypothetical protein B0J18DRAFT_466563 [Chaetomium sp. MPI-SDFR-AT-0129]